VNTRCAPPRHDPGVRRRAPTLFLLVSLIVTTAGCGSSGNTRATNPHLTLSAEAQYQVRALVSAYERALSEANASAACEDMTETLQQQIVLETQRTAPTVTSCTQAMTLALKVGQAKIDAALGKTVVRSIVISGDRATIVSVRAGRQVASRALHEASGWKLEESP
jgi:predicted GTPase